MELLIVILLGLVDKRAHAGVAADDLRNQHQHAARKCRAVMHGDLRVIGVVRSKRQSLTCSTRLAKACRRLRLESAFIERKSRFRNMV